MTNDPRVDKVLYTMFFLSTDREGNTLTSEQKGRIARLHRRHKRFMIHNCWNQRLNERMRDIGMLGANLHLPKPVQTDALHFLKAAKAARLPGGRMSWEAPAGGAIFLASLKAGVERKPADVSMYVKTTSIWVGAAAQKIRMQPNAKAKS